MNGIIKLMVVFFSLSTLAAVDLIDHSVTRRWNPHSNVKQKTLSILGRTMAIRWWSEKPTNSYSYYARVSIIDYDFNRVKNLVDDVSSSTYSRTQVKAVALSENQDKIFLATESYYSSSIYAYNVSTFDSLGSHYFYNRKVFGLQVVPKRPQLLIAYVLDSYNDDKIDEEHTAEFKVIDYKRRSVLHTLDFKETGNGTNQAQLTESGNLIFLAEHSSEVKIWSTDTGKVLHTFKLGKKKADRLLVNRKNGEVVVTFDKTCVDLDCATATVKAKYLSKDLKEIHQFSSVLDSSFQIDWNKGLLYDITGAKAGAGNLDTVSTIELNKSEKKSSFSIQSAILSAKNVTWDHDKMMVAGVIGDSLYVDFLRSNKHQSFQVEKRSREVVSLNFESDGYALWVHYKDGSATRVIF